ncbi:hypothetical protein SAMN05444003_3029 [Cognatiyoonia sediminum]|uniref:Uncharacterized protein n=1 Tax=Cognatiyoonia sediminum TaxID=1508389 RepID=A0A1M5SKY7_9RHOB|nr:hypothetical protein [Cognatiyoonia sediminum]SHH39216.1 hypothetical protein SAMN05444003_3029 [Cognatiyoonia sediminum]
MALLFFCGGLALHFHKQLRSDWEFGLQGEITLVGELIFLKT